MSTAKNLNLIDIFPTAEKHNFKPPCKITLKHSGQIKPHGRLILQGDFIHIHPSVELDLTADIILYEDVDITEDVKIFTHRHLWNHSRGRRNDIEIIEPVSLIINEDVYIGRGAVILGVREIGKGVVIGAGSVLTKSVPCYEVWAGNPAKKINERMAYH